MFKHRGPVSSDLTVLPKRPDNFGSLDQDRKEEIDNLLKSEIIHKCYLAITHGKNRRHWVALDSQEELRLQPMRIVPNVWEESNVFFLRRALLRVVHQWEELCSNSGPCPVKFSEQEMALYQHEEENIDAVGEILETFHRNWGLSPEGLIEPGKFDEVQIELAQMKDAFVDASGSEEDWLLAKKNWPFQNTPVG